jgi:hypothetical protein
MVVAYSSDLTSFYSYTISINPTANTHGAPQIVTSATGFTAVSCPTATSCIADSNTGDVLLTTNATSATPTWTVDAVPSLLGNNANMLSESISCPSDDFCGSASNYPNFLTGNPTSDVWTQPVAPFNLAASEFIACPSSTECLAAQNYGWVAAGLGATLSVSLAGSGSGSVSDSDGQLVCPGSACTATYALDSGETITAHPSAGSTFAGWSGACSGTGTCTVSLESNQAVTATFTAATAPTSKGSTQLLDVVWEGSFPFYGWSLASSPQPSACTGAGCSGLNCKENPCLLTYPAGVTVSLTLSDYPLSSDAPAETGHYILGGGCPGTPTCTLTLSNSNETVDVSYLGGTIPKLVGDILITKAKIRGTSASFAFAGTGLVTVSGSTGEQCALVRDTAGKHGRPRYAGCSSYKTYTHLPPSKYTFYVRADGEGVVGPATTRSFTIGGHGSRG